MGADALERLSALLRRRARRTFTGAPVADDDVERIIDAARWTGSARNRQPWRFVAVTHPGTMRELAALGAYAGHLADAPLVLVLLSHDDGRRDTEFDVGRVSQSLTLAAEALELSTCLATFYPDTNVARAASLLEVTGPWSPRHAMAVGHAPPRAHRTGVPVLPRGRKTVAELLRRHPG